MKSSKSNTKIPVATNFFFEVSSYGASPTEGNGSPSTHTSPVSGRSPWVETIVKYHLVCYNILCRYKAYRLLIAVLYGLLV